MSKVTIEDPLNPDLLEEIEWLAFSFFDFNILGGFKPAKSFNENRLAFLSSNDVTDFLQRIPLDKESIKRFWYFHQDEILAGWYFISEGNPLSEPKDLPIIIFIENRLKEAFRDKSKDLKICFPKDFIHGS
jgi:hypothetical protein